MSDPVAVMGAIRALTTALDEGSKEIFRLQVEFEKAEEVYDDLRNDLLMELMEEHADKGTVAGIKYARLPGEDIRNAAVIKRMRNEHPLEYGAWRRARAELNRTQDLYKSKERQVSALQSCLSMLRTETQAVGA